MNEYEKAIQYLHIALNSAAQSSDDYGVHQSGYYEVGTAIKALEKQMPKKPVKKNPICYSKSKDGEELYAYDYHCPLCDVKVNGEKHHCPCGQALDWNSQ